VFTGRYPRPPNGPPGTTIPARYATEVLALANALGSMPAGPLTLSSGTQGIGILVADSLMYRRGGPQQSDPFLSAFFGMALPAIIAGMPARCVSMETLESVGVPTGMRLLLLSYDGMTPPDAASHNAIATWVRSGNALLLFGTGDDPYATLPGWWNNQHGGTGPLADLYQRLGLPPTPAMGLNSAGAGVVLIEPRGPIALAQDPTGSTLVRAHIRDALAGLGAGAPVYAEQGYVLLQRGQYTIAAAPAEAPGAVPTIPVLTLSSTYVNLFDGTLPVLHGYSLLPDRYIVLIDLATLDHSVPQVVAAGARITGETVTGGVLHFRATGPLDTTAVVRLLLPHAPTGVAGQDVAINFSWDAASSTALLQFANSPNGVNITVM
jgi:hypothetical protein